MEDQEVIPVVVKCSVLELCILIYHCCTQNSSNITKMEYYSLPSQNILNGGNQNFTVSNLEVYKAFY